MSTSKKQTEISRLLTARGESFTDLSRKCGLNIQTLYNIASGGNKTRSGRAAVERALGITIWPKSDTPEAAS